MQDILKLFRLLDVIEYRIGEFYAHGGTNIESARLVARGETGHQRVIGE